jgi:hypothetical protein
MKIIVKIDADAPEGRQLIEYLKTFPEVVTFEDTMLHEPQPNYMTKPKTTFTHSENYVTAEEFRTEAKKRAKTFLKKHGLHS